MAGVFDATLKQMMSESPEDWMKILGLKADSIDVLDTDLSEISTVADKVFRVGGAKSWILHSEAQSSWDEDLDERLLCYNCLIRRRHKLPIRTVLVLLRKEANSPSLTGLYQDWLPDDPDPNVWFRYDVLRLWTLPVETILSGGLWTLPLAPLANVSKSEIGSVIQQIRPRLDRAPTETSKQLWLMTYFLLGLRLPKEQAQQLIPGVAAMKESTTYQAILEEGIEQGLEQGRAEESRQTIFRLGTKRFGAPDEAERAAVEAVDDLKTLEAIVDRLIEVDNWQRLLEPLTPGDDAPSQSS